MGPHAWSQQPAGLFVGSQPPVLPPDGGPHAWSDESRSGRREGVRVLTLPLPSNSILIGPSVSSAMTGSLSLSPSKHHATVARMQPQAAHAATAAAAAADTHASPMHAHAASASPSAIAHASAHSTQPAQTSQSLHKHLLQSWLMSKQAAYSASSSAVAAAAAAASGKVSWPGAAGQTKPAGGGSAPSFGSSSPSTRSAPKTQPQLQRSSFDSEGLCDVAPTPRGLQQQQQARHSDSVPFSMVALTLHLSSLPKRPAGAEPRARSSPQGKGKGKGRGGSEASTDDEDAASEGSEEYRRAVDEAQGPGGMQGMQGAAGPGNEDAERGRQRDVASWVAAAGGGGDDGGSDGRRSGSSGSGGSDPDAASGVLSPSAAVLSSRPPRPSHHEPSGASGDGQPAFPPTHAASSPLLTFWGGIPSPAAAPAPRTSGSRPGSLGSGRPGTASSYWSNYDLDEDTMAELEARKAFALSRRGSSSSTSPAAAAAAAAAALSCKPLLQLPRGGGGSSAAAAGSGQDSPSSLSPTGTALMGVGSGATGGRRLGGLQPASASAPTIAEEDASSLRASLEGVDDWDDEGGGGQGRRPHRASEPAGASPRLPLTPGSTASSSQQQGRTGSEGPRGSGASGKPSGNAWRAGMPPRVPVPAGGLGGGGPASARKRGGGSSGGSTPSRAQPYAKTPHPAVIMDASLLSLCPRPVAEEPSDEKERPYPYVLPPAFPGAYPTIAFNGSAAHKQAMGLHPLMRVKVFVKYAGIANSPVKFAFKEAGLRPTQGGKWNVSWGKILDADEMAKLTEFQRVNHFPGTWELGRKDYLYRNVYSMRRAKGDAFDFIPRFFLLPRDFDEYKQDLERYPGRMYIQKPVNSSRGRGIRMVSKPQDISRDTKDVLIQHYIDRPYTINGYKFDMRVYVCATCVDPLRLYVYCEGLARFATEQYSHDKADLKKRCVHLTNYSVNKKSPKAASAAAGEPAEGDDDSTMCKWSMKTLREHMQKEGRVAWDYVWRQVHDIAVKAVLSAEPRINTETKMKMPHRNNCFEVWGFDIMLDDTFRAWMIEANTCPSLAADSPLDRRIKNSMVADVMHMVGVTPYDTALYSEEQEARKQARLTGLNPKAAAAPGQGTAASTSSGDSGKPTSTSRAPSPTANSPSPRGSGRSGGSQQQQQSQQQQGKGPGMPRTVREAEELDFRGLSPEELPEIICEAEAEYARRGGWQRVFPCVQDPYRYLDLFDTPRASNIMLCNYYAQKKGATRERPASGTEDRSPLPTGSRQGSRGGPREWKHVGARG